RRRPPSLFSLLVPAPPATSTLSLHDALPIFTLRQLLSHRSGVSAISEPMAPEQLFDWQAMTAAIAAQEPWWEPGSRHGYAPLTYAWLLGEPLRRLSGQMPGDYLRERLFLPLGMDFHVGVPDADL